MTKEQQGLQQILTCIRQRCVGQQNGGTRKASCQTCDFVMVVIFRVRTNFQINYTYTDVKTDVVSVFLGPINVFQRFHSFFNEFITDLNFVTLPSQHSCFRRQIIYAP